MKTYFVNLDTTYMSDTQHDLLDKVFSDAGFPKFYSEFDKNGDYPYYRANLSWTIVETILRIQDLILDFPEDLNLTSFLLRGSINSSIECINGGDDHDLLPLLRK